MHSHYTRAEIEAAFGVLSTEAPWIHREGVLWQQASATDLLFITLRKSEALFSPSCASASGSATLACGQVVRATKATKASGRWRGGNLCGRCVASAARVLARQQRTSQVEPAQDDPITTNSCSATRRRHGRSPGA